MRRFKLVIVWLLIVATLVGCSVVILTRSSGSSVRIGNAVDSVDVSRGVMR